jgi:hypothetical protein
MFIISREDWIIINENEWQEGETPVEPIPDSPEQAGGRDSCRADS